MEASSVSLGFPDPEQAGPNGLLAVGGDLAPETLIEAYSNGIFPWFGEHEPVLWWSPDPRMVLFPHEFHCSRRLARRLRQGRYAITHDRAFAEVIHACATHPRPGQQGTWIVPSMIRAYMRLHELGLAHSVEVWEKGHLVGGLYEVLLGRVFFAESMFSRVRDGSKMALAELCRQGISDAWALIDCQFYTKHLASLGAREIPRSRFLSIVRVATKKPG